MGSISQAEEFLFENLTENVIINKNRNLKEKAMRGERRESPA
jgi:hypothetical protein